MAVQPITDLRTLPKAELHRHLEGSVRLSTIIDLAREAGASLPADSPDELAPHAQVLQPVSSLEDALAKFGLARGAFRSYEAIRRITFEAVEDLDADGVRLGELRFSPAFMCRPAGLDWDGALEAVLQGVQDARTTGFDVAVGLIVIASRDLGMRSFAETVAFALRHRDNVVGFDIAGPELGYPPDRYARALTPIRDAGIHLTTHYGESGPPEYARAAIEVLGAERLGHGVSVAHDLAVADIVVERGVTLEMCPTSNFLTRAVSTVADHPARRLLHRGARVTLNTDDPGIFATSLTREHEVARDAIGFSDEDFRAAARSALLASFLPEDVVTETRARHFAWAG